MNGDAIDNEMRFMGLDALAESILQGVYVAGYRIKTWNVFQKKPSFDDPLDQIERVGVKVIAELSASPERYLVYAGHTINKLQRELEEAPTLKAYVRHKWRQLKMLFQKG